VTYQTVHHGYNRKDNKRRNSRKFIHQTIQYIVVKVFMTCDILVHVADEIRSNKARVTLQLDESTDVSNSTYLLVYCRYTHAVKSRA